MIKMKLKILPMLIGCIVVFSVCQFVSCVHIPESKIIISCLALTGQLPSVLSGVISITPYGIMYLKSLPNTQSSYKTQPNTWYDAKPRPKQYTNTNKNHYDDDVNNYDDDVDDGEYNDDDTNDKRNGNKKFTRNDDYFQMETLKEEDEIEQLKADHTGERLDDEYADGDHSYEGIVVKNLASKFTKDRLKLIKKNENNEEEEGGDDDVPSFGSSLSSMLSSFLNTNAETKIYRNAKSFNADTSMKNSDIKEPNIINPRSNRIKRSVRQEKQMQLSTYQLRPFYHVNNRVRSMKRPLIAPVYAPKPMIKFGQQQQLSQRDSTAFGLATQPIKLASNQLTGARPIGNTFPGGGINPNSVASGGTTGTKLGSGGNNGVATKNSGGGGNSGSGGNKKGSGAGNKNNNGNKPTSSETDSGEDDSDEDDSNEPGDEGGPGEGGPGQGGPGSDEIYNEENSGSNESNSIDLNDAPESEEDYD